MYRVMIAEDDSVISSSVARHIEKWGFDVHIAEDFLNIKGEFEEFSPHILLLDIMLPFYNGYHWCQEIRRISNVPIVFISSASDNMNIILAMNMGADDFIAKPFDLGVLNAKIQALLRRSYNYNVQTPKLSHRGAELDTEEACLVYGELKIELTKNELRILQTLMQAEGIVSRDTLMEKLWETDSFIDENTLSVNVARLRKKLDSAGLCGFIATKKGLGYELA
ncbi:MAG: response regulator [Eubacteriales bacterium]